MWQQNYAPLGGDPALSALVAALPIFVMLLLLGVLRRPAWVAALSGLGIGGLLALTAFGMPGKLMISSAGYGAAFGIFPISWILFWAIMLHRLTVEKGSFRVLKDSIGGLTSDQRLQALLIAFVFGALLEGAAGFGAPVAIAAAMLVGLGVPRFYAAAVCLFANTAPVAFGSIGIPVITLAGVTGLPVRDLSVWVGRICAPVSMAIPAYLILVIGGRKSLGEVLPAVVLCGLSFGATQWLVSSLLGPQLTDIFSSLTSMCVLMALLAIWKPKEAHVWAREPDMEFRPVTRATDSPGIVRAWSPYLFLVLFVFLWGLGPVKTQLDKLTLRFPWPALDNQIERMPPAVIQPSAYAAIYVMNWMSASGSACLLAVLATAFVFRVTPREFARVLIVTAKELALPILTIASVLALAFLLNYCGATATMALAFASTGHCFPFFSALLGWIGVFLTGSDTSANALFGSLQVVTASQLGLDPVLMAASNSSGGVMGKMISLSSIAVAAAATGLTRSDEAKLFRFMLRHSVILATAIGVIVTIYACIKPPMR